MVNFVSWEQAQVLVRQEPVLFAEIMSEAPEGQKLEIHVMSPTSKGLHEAERDDTGRVPRDKVQDLLTRIAEGRSVRYAAIRGAEDRWPPEWVRSAQ